jgi:hypothetical protein
LAPAKGGKPANTAAKSSLSQNGSFKLKGGTKQNFLTKNSKTGYFPMILDIETGKTYLSMTLIFNKILF